ncbi:MAG TPA: hypothetical protein DDY68_01900 [Porphyromonadaceae bacterium]|nr:hypothetical protein [Porphyromonadaceae bacterium]
MYNENRENRGSHSTQVPLVSKSVKAGSRLYYLDLKKCSTGDLLLNITESRKFNPGPDSQEAPTVERHKVFVYQEDLFNFRDALNEIIAYAEGRGLMNTKRPEE